MSAYRCATCGIQYPTRRALTYHLRKHKDKGEPHAACNDDCGHRSSSGATNTTSAKQTSYSVLPDISFDTSKQPAVSGGGIPGSYAGITVFGDKDGHSGSAADSL